MYMDIWEVKRWLRRIQRWKSRPSGMTTQWEKKRAVRRRDVIHKSFKTSDDSVSLKRSERHSNPTVMETEPKPKNKRYIHNFISKWGEEKTCIICHYNLFEIWRQEWMNWETHLNFFFFNRIFSELKMRRKEKSVLGILLPSGDNVQKYIRRITRTVCVWLADIIHMFSIVKQFKIMFTLGFLSFSGIWTFEHKRFGISRALPPHTKPKFIAVATLCFKISFFFFFWLFW